MVFSSDGYILTNHHVVAGAESVNVVFSDGKVYSAELIGTDPLTDLGVVKVEHRRTDTHSARGSGGGLRR